MLHIKASDFFVKEIYTFSQIRLLLKKEQKEILLLPAWFAGDVQAAFSLFTGAQPLDGGKI